MITEDIIETNKQRFLDLVNGIERPGVDKERLMDKLLNSDFFEAPASAIYHNAFMGGLCAHSLNVYDSLEKLCRAFYTKYDENGECMGYACPYSEDTIRIVALFHDFDKMNKYEKTVRNKKVYSPTGSKYDEMGKFDWQAVAGYTRKEDKDVFTVGTHGENSVYMTETFIPLSVEEHCAILTHDGIFGNPNLDITTVYSKYHLACLLHLADMLSTYVLES